jgi:Flp pilus assembly protein TadD
MSKGGEKMNKKARIRIAIPLVLLSSLFTFSITGCSMFRNMSNWITSVDSAEKGKTIKNEDVAQFFDSIRPHKGNIDSIYGLARHLQERKKHKLAIEEFKKVIGLNPTFAKAYNAIGVSYDMLGEFPHAVQSYKAALAWNPDLDYVHNNLGYSYLLQGDIDSAIGAFQRAITLDNKNKRYHNNLGMAYAKKDEFDLAFEEFKLAGDEGSAHYNIAQFYYQNGLYAQAKSHFAKASAMNPANRDTKVGLRAAKNLATISLSRAEKRSMPFPGEMSPPADKQPSEERDKTTPATEAREAEKNIETRKPNIPLLDKTQEKVQRDKEGTQYVIHAGAFRNRTYAEVMRKRLKDKGYTACIVKEQRREPLYMIKVGGFSSRRDAEKEARKLEGEGVKTFMVPEKNETEESLLIAHVANAKGIKPNAPDPETYRKKRDPLRDIDIEISNGNGVRHMARTVGNYLKEQGFKDPFLTNATHFNHGETKIYYCNGYLQDAYVLAQQIPGYQNMEKVLRFEKSDTKVKLLIGKDLIRFKKVFTGGVKTYKFL